MKNLDWALRYYQAGWLIFPCRDKRPHSQALAPWEGKWSWIKRETLTEAIIRNWWQQFPNAQIALVCGAQSGITVLDIDWLKTLNTNQPDLKNSIDPAVLAGELPVALMSITGGRGRHVFYRYTDMANSVKALHPQMDVRSEGGYVILPPSIHANGCSYIWDEDFAWSEMCLANLPEFPRDASVFTGSVKMDKPKDWVGVMQGVLQGSRNETTAALAGKLLRSLDAHLSWEIINLWNQYRNEPPLSFQELSTTFTSILKRKYAK